MGKKSGPSTPDPMETAQAEARANRVSTYSPSGAGVRYGYVNKNGDFRSGSGPKRAQAAQQYVESDTERQIREALEPASLDLTGRVIDDNITNMPDAPRVQDRSDVAQDMFNRSFSLMAPGIEKTNERLLTNLQARGIPIGSEAFNDAYGEQLRQTQDTIGRLALDSNLVAGQEQSREFGLDMSARQGAMSEIIAAMGGGYNPPNTIPSGQVQPVNVSNGYAAEASAHAARQKNMVGGAAALGNLGAALIKSSRDFKDVVNLTNPAVAADMVAKTPIYAWAYKPEHRPAGDKGTLHVGPMAEDFHENVGLGQPQYINPIDYMGVLMAALQNALARIELLEGATVRTEAEIQLAQGASVH